MTTHLKTLEAQALDMMKRGDFGSDAARVNTEIVAAAPANVSAWTRLGRCRLEQRQFDEAVVALRTALALNPTHTVATNLLNEVRKRRAMTPSATERATSGFAAREFALLETLPPADALRALQTRMDALFHAVNTASIAATIVAARRKQGASGDALFHANSVHAGGTGHLFAYQHGGRWEPQLNIGWFSGPPAPASAVRIGIGFKTAGRDADRDGNDERVLASFERFQRTLERSWTRELARWMGASGGFIQYGANPPALDLRPERAVEWLIDARALSSLGWIFVGRWLFLHDGDAARVLADRAKLASAVDDVFRTLYPLWIGAFTEQA
jgi:hypothetical protein